MDIREAFMELQSKFNELVRKHNDLVLKHNNLAQQVMDFAKHRAAGNLPTINDQAREVIVENYRRAVGYTNLVMLAGYAGFFTLLHAFGADMPKSIALCVGLLLSVSIFFFAVSEVFKMIDQSLFIRKITQLAEQGLEPPERLAAYQEAGRRVDLRQAKWWPRLLIATLASGLPAGLILIGYFVYKLIWS